jgi:hypothetical protein
MAFGDNLAPPVRIRRNLYRGLLSIWRRRGHVGDYATSLGFAGVAGQSHQSKHHCVLRLKPEPHCLKGDSKPRVQHVEISNDAMHARQHANLSEEAWFQSAQPVG